MTETGHRNGRARVVTVAQQGRWFSTVEENRRYMLGLLDGALDRQPDLVCLPESFPSCGSSGPVRDTAESVPGPTTDLFAARALKARCHIVCPLYEAAGDRVYNSAVLLDRRGEIAGVYRKHCPVTTCADYTVMEEGVTPGSELPVFDLDFGRVAVQICFDVGFPENWAVLAKKGARLIVWPSAYDGGFPLRVYAYLHHVWVVSSTRSGASRVVDPCGEVLAETTDADPIAVRDLNLDYVVAHTDWNLSVMRKLRERYDDRVAVRQWDAGSGHFLAEPVDPALTSELMMREVGFEPTALYHERHRRAYRALRAGRNPSPQRARHGRRPQWGEW
ncbi:MAG TPA: carbon-nitrogen hydrolase family protein [Chthonomonadales bacterium]|nr:carbon-nitrogen hydrolase family protein [Chthonomonadales bacterium]